MRLASSIGKLLKKYSQKRKNLLSWTGGLTALGMNPKALLEIQLNDWGAVEIKIVK